MKISKFFAFLALIVLVGTVVVAPAAEAYVSVRGYYRSNGTYVRPYVRSTPNAFKFDNYSYSGGSRYNSSYYTPTRSYSSSWYTPSWSTDSSYYFGKSLYNSRSYNYYGTSLYNW